MGLLTERSMTAWERDLADRRRAEDEHLASVIRGVVREELALKLVSAPGTPARQES